MQKKFQILKMTSVALVATFCFTVLVASTAQAAVPGLHSAYRYPTESFNRAARRYLSRINQYKQYVNPGQLQALQQGKSALQSAVPYNQLNFSRIPSWPSQQQALRYFQQVRDVRFMTPGDGRNFKRRISWLYPDDGCFARAGLVRQVFKKWGITQMGKAFIFGNLEVKTPNSPSGRVRWWYHVVPVYLVGQVPFVMDPAIRAKYPLRLDQWILTMTNDVKNVKVALCDAKTYSPGSNCLQPGPNDDSRAHADQQRYLGAEWNRMASLGRDPQKELGDNPPWKR